MKSVTAATKSRWGFAKTTEGYELVLSYRADQLITLPAGEMTVVQCLSKAQALELATAILDEIGEGHRLKGGSGGPNTP